jgi:predicted RNA-binding Zn-ribbon protein involved in translation (DUF1610 family)
MSVEVAPLEREEKDHDVLPFRLRDISPVFAFSDLYPIAKPLDRIQSELKFQTKLAVREWNSEYWVTLAIGLAGFLLGAVSTELLSGGDAQKVAWDGLAAVRGVAFFQMLLSLICWSIFTMQIWRLFPVIRIHAISLLVLWNLTMVSQLFFHVNQIDFPSGATLGDMMLGTLILLVVLFFIYNFGKAVIETRNLHVEEYHVHEDVRQMEMEMAEHSLRGWSFVLGTWFVMILISSWAGAHFVSERGGDRIGSLSVHIVTGALSMPLYMCLIWYPQRMLGTGTQVTTKAAFRAEKEIRGTLVVELEQESQCPECETPVNIYRDENGLVMVPCPTAGCSKSNAVGTECQSCSTFSPSRYDCPKCGINAPALDFLSDMEAW